MNPSNPLPSRKAACQGFTLIEMLVVIAIIAILASLIVPTISSSIARAKTVACQNNLRQIAAAVMTYAGQNEGDIVNFQRSTARGHSENSVWGGLLVESESMGGSFSDSPNDINANTAFRCPAGLADTLWTGNLPSGPDLAPADQKNVMRPWAAAHDLNGETKYVHLWYAANADTFYHRWPFTRQPDTKRATKLSEVRFPAKTVMFYDGVWCHNRSDGRFYGRHGTGRDKLNMSFFDGHVATFEAQRFAYNSTDKYAYPRFRK